MRILLPMIVAALLPACSSPTGHVDADPHQEVAPRETPRPLVGPAEKANTANGVLEMMVDGKPWKASDQQLTVRIHEWTSKNGITITATHPDTTEAMWRFIFQLPYFYAEDTAFELTSKRLGGINANGLGHLPFVERSFKGAMEKTREGDRFGLSGTFSAEYYRRGDEGQVVRITEGRFSAGLFTEPRRPIMETDEGMIDKDHPGNTYGYGVSHVGRVDGVSVILFSTVFTYTDDHGGNEKIKARLQELFTAHMAETGLKPVKLSGSVHIDLRPDEPSVIRNRGRTMDSRLKYMDWSARPLTATSAPKRIIEVQVPDAL